MNKKISLETYKETVKKETAKLKELLNHKQSDALIKCVIKNCNQELKISIKEGIKRLNDICKSNNKIKIKMCEPKNFEMLNNLINEQVITFDNYKKAVEILMNSFDFSKK